MKRIILAVLISFGCLYLYSQSFQAKVTGDILAQCPTPVASGVLFCQVANDPANPTGVYVSGNGAPYFKLSAVVQQSQITPAQLPSKFTCSLAASVSASSTATLTNCQ